MPYAVTLAAVSLIGYVIIGITGSGLLGFVVSLALLVGTVYVLHKRAVKANAEAEV